MGVDVSRSFSMFEQYLSEEPSIINSLSRMLQIDHRQIRDQFLAKVGADTC
jgi:hypothetical protein